MTIFISIVGLGLLILIHELGHFSASLALGMRPRKFYIGFPPAIVKRTRKGIEYGIGIVPLGGFVKIPGMHRPAPGDVDQALGRAVAEAPELEEPADRLRRALAVGRSRRCPSGARRHSPTSQAAVSGASRRHGRSRRA